MGGPREEFLEACQTVVKAFAPEGFRWLRSKCDLVRKDEPFTFRLHFQSSFRNFLANATHQGPSRGPTDRVASSVPTLFVPLGIQLMEIDEYGSVKLIPHVEVDDTRIAEWRTTMHRPVRSDGSVMGSNLGYLSEQRSWLEINLANPQVRDSRVAALISLIRTKALPFFARFHRDEDVLEKLVETGFEGALDFAEVEHAVFLGGVEAGRKVIERCFRKWPTAEVDYRIALADYRKNGIQEVWESTAGHRLAKAAILLGIE